MRIVELAAYQRSWGPLGLRVEGVVEYTVTGRANAVITRSGLCESCVYAQLVLSSKGSSFVRCGLSATDPRFPRYPRLPVVQCGGFVQKATEDDLSPRAVPDP
jgi:hypothetical protein